MNSAEKPTSDILESTFAGINWYKLQYARMVKALGVLVLVLLLSIAANVLQFMTKPNPKYFAQTPDLRITEMVALNEPYITKEGLIDWTTETVMQALSLDFLHWRDDLMAIRGNFTEEAFKQIVQSLRAAGIIEMLEVKRLAIRVAIDKPPVITNSGVHAGAHVWKVEVPVVLSYENSNGVTNAQRLLAEIIVRRVSVLDNPKGVQIYQLLMNPRG